MQRLLEHFINGIFKSVIRHAAKIMEEKSWSVEIKQHGGQEMIEDHYMFFEDLFFQRQKRKSINILTVQMATISASKKYISYII